MDLYKVSKDKSMKNTRKNMWEQQKEYRHYKSDDKEWKRGSKKFEADDVVSTAAEQSATVGEDAMDVLNDSPNIVLNLKTSIQELTSFFMKNSWKL